MAQAFEKISRSDLPLVAQDMRRDILTMCHDCGGQKGHLGGAMSAVETLAVLYTQVMNIGDLLHGDGPWALRDRFIMSKGHASMAMYAAMKQVGLVSQEMIDGPVRGESSVLHRHPKRNVSYGIECSSGSLGLGLGYGIGLAEVFRRRGTHQQVFVMLGDGECDEGSVWEAASYASHRGLDHITVIVDKNGLQLDGPTSDVLDKGNLRDRWEAFGFVAVECNGHDVDQLIQAFQTPHEGRPLAIVANTTKGKGISFAEGRTDWHDHILDDDLFDQGIADVGPYDQERVRSRARRNYDTRRSDFGEEAPSLAVSPGAAYPDELASSLGGLSMRDSFGAALACLADADPDLALLYSDCGARIGIDLLRDRHPQTCYEVGIAEQNMIGMATAMAEEGLHVFATTYAPFATGRALDQIKVGLAYMQAPVCLVGLNAGFAMSDLGATHMALEDVAWMRALPGVTVRVPADNVGLAQDLAAQLAHPAPTYLRLTSGACGAGLHDADQVHADRSDLEVLASGADVAFFACGSLIPAVLKATQLLADQGLTCTICDVRTVKPLSVRIPSDFLDHRLLVSVEEHSSTGGLGTAIAERLAELDRHPRLLRLGTPDAYFAADLPEVELTQSGLDAGGIFGRVLQALGKDL